MWNLALWLFAGVAASSFPQNQAAGVSQGKRALATAAALIGMSYCSVSGMNCASVGKSEAKPKGAMMRRRPEPTAVVLKKSAGLMPPGSHEARIPLFKASLPVPLKNLVAVAAHAASMDCSSARALERAVIGGAKKR